MNVTLDGDAHRPGQVKLEGSQELLRKLPGNAPGAHDPGLQGQVVEGQAVIIRHSQVSHGTEVRVSDWKAREVRVTGSNPADCPLGLPGSGRLISVPKASLSPTMSM